MILLTKD